MMNLRSGIDSCLGHLLSLYEARFQFVFYSAIADARGGGDGQDRNQHQTSDTSSLLSSRAFLFLCFFPVLSFLYLLLFNPCPSYLFITISELL
jgi:hypothetical protein